MWNTELAAGLVARAGDRAADRARPARTSAEGLVPSKQWRDQLYKPKARPNAPGRPATTSSWRPGRATCRPTRCRWRSPTPRSATAARSSPRTSAWKSRTPPAGCCRNSTRSRGARSRSTPATGSAILEGLHEAAQVAGRHLVRRLRRLPGRGRRQDRDRATARRTATSPGTRCSLPYPNPRIVTIVTIEEGGFGAESAAPAALQILEAYFHKQAKAKSRPPTAGARTDVRDRGPDRARPEPFAVRTGIAERLGLAHMDWPLTLAAVALVAFSVFTLGQATQTRRPRQPQLLRRPPGDLRPARGGRDAGPDPDRLLALPRAAGRHLHLPLRQRRAGLRLRLRRPRLAALLRTSLLQLPAIGARQAPARACARRVRHRWRQTRLSEAAHGALPLPRPGTGCARFPAAGPRHLAGVRRRDARRDVLRGCSLDSLRGHRRGSRRPGIASFSSWRPQWGVPS